MFNQQALQTVRKSCQTVLDILTMTNRDQDRLQWYNDRLSSLRTDFYKAVDSDKFDDADRLGRRVQRLTIRRDQVLARQCATYDNFRF